MLVRSSPNGGKLSAWESDFKQKEEAAQGGSFQLASSARNILLKITANTTEMGIMAQFKFNVPAQSGSHFISLGRAKT